MADTIQRVDYFYTMVPDKPGEAARMLAVLRDAGVNLLAFSGFPEGRRGQLDFVPADAGAFRQAAKKAGWKLTGPKRAFLLGGEESGGLSIAGHVPEKDGILACLLMLELVAFEGKPLAKIREQLFKKHGEFHNVRLNFHLEGPTLSRDLSDRLKVKPPTILAGASVWRIDESDGFKFVLKDGRWLGMRFSGTEPVVRLYAEAGDAKSLAVLVEEGKKIIAGKK